MGMFMAIYVRYSQTGSLHFADLRFDLGGNLRFAYLSTLSCPDKRYQAVAKLIGASIGREQRRYLLRFTYRSAIHQHHVTSHTEAWILFDEVDSLAKCLRVGHQRR